MNSISVLLAEDHVITRQGIRRLLEDTEDLTVIGEANDGDEAVQIATELKPNVIVMDINFIVAAIIIIVALFVFEPGTKFLILFGSPSLHSR